MLVSGRPDHKHPASLLSDKESLEARERESRNLGIRPVSRVDIGNREREAGKVQGLEEELWG